MPSTNETNRKAYFIEIMKRRILSGELKPGDRIPPERELAAELGISRGSVNQECLILPVWVSCGSCHARVRLLRNM